MSKPILGITMGDPFGNGPEDHRPGPQRQDRL